MVASYIYICNCILCLVPCALCCCNCDLSAIWFGIWLLANGYIFQDPILGLLSGTDSISEFTDTLPSLPLESIGLFFFMLCNIIMFVMIINTPPGNDYSNRSEKFYTLNCFQCLFMFSTLSSFSSEYRFILLLSPLVFGILYGCTAKFDIAGLSWLCAIWAFFNFALYFGPWNYSNPIKIVIYWAIIPFIEFWLVCYACGMAGGLVLEAFINARNTKLSSFINRRFYSSRHDTNSCNFRYGYIFILMIVYTLLSGFEYLLKIIHGYYPTVNSFIFFAAYLSPIGELAVFQDKYAIHKCDVSKLSFLSYTSILGSVYVVRFALNL